jgi:hypothetical protein
VVSEENVRSDLQTRFSVCASLSHCSDAANSLSEMGKFVHDVENEMFCESINTKIPYFNAPVYLENKVYTSEHYADDATN